MVFRYFADTIAGSCPVLPRKQPPTKGHRRNKVGVEKSAIGMKLADRLLAQLGGISIEEAVEMLRDWGYADEAIVIPGEDGNKASSPWRILNEELMADYPAAGCTILFNGGPPGNTYWYTGTLLTMVVDKIMFTIVSEKLKLFYCERPGIKVEVR